MLLLYAQNCLVAPIGLFTNQLVQELRDFYSKLCTYKTC